MTLKAIEKDDSSDSIVVSFNAKWAPIFPKNSISCVFRKRGPKHSEMKWIYVYVGIPVKALLGRLPILQLRHLSVEESISMANAGALDSHELRKYASDYASLYVFDVGDFQPALKHIELEKLKNDHFFTPPQSFLILSIDGKKSLDVLCGFEESSNL